MKKVRWLLVWRLCSPVLTLTLTAWLFVWFFLPYQWRQRVPEQAFAQLRWQNTQLRHENIRLAAENTVYAKALFVMDRVSLQNELARSDKQQLMGP